MVAMRAVLVGLLILFVSVSAVELTRDNFWGLVEPEGGWLIKL